MKGYCWSLVGTELGCDPKEAEKIHPEGLVTL